ncbi:MAG TPA: bacteriophage Gp15 family protein [Alloiococcus sp.]|nr:bacteriophage Gp15 family protein [Alloiococcus sp.]
MDLAYPLTNTVEIDGITYDIDLSFDNVLRLFDMLSDKELSDVIQIETGLEMLLNVCFLYDIEAQEEIFYQVFKSTIGKDIDDSQPVDIEGNPMPSMDEANEKTYDLKQDAGYIYASFMSDYGIDLLEEQGKLHWDKFKALLGGLTDGSKFLKVIEIRTAELPKGKGTGKQREQMKKLKRIYALKGDEPDEGN